MMPDRFPLRVLVPFLLVVCGCNIGPRRLPEDGERYNHAMQRLMQQQLLLNLVRLRMGEPAEFLHVDTIASQHSIDRSAMARGDLFEASPKVSPNSLALSGGVTLGERPVVTFATTDTCELFNTRMRTPIQLDMLRFLTDSGWEIDRVLRVAVARINGYSNLRITRPGGPPPLAQGVEQFEQICQTMRSLQEQDLLQFRIVEYAEPTSAPFAKDLVELEQLVTANESGYETRDPGDGKNLQLYERERWLALQFRPQETLSPEVQSLQQLLGVPAGSPVVELRAQDVLLPDGSEKHVAPASTPVRMRSLMEVFRFLAVGMVLVPEESPVQHAGGAPLQVLVSDDEPAEALVALEHCDRWYSIPRCDPDSAATFTMLLEMYRIQVSCGSTPASTSSPLLTIPLFTP